MLKISNRKGWAVSAAMSLMVSFFSGLPAQAATDGANIGAYPAAGTTFVGTVHEDFPVYVQLKPGNTYANFASDLVFKVEKTAGTNMHVRVSASSVVSDAASQDSDSPAVSTNVPNIAAGSTTSVTVSGLVANGAGYLNFKAFSDSPAVSWSAVTLKVTAWLDAQGGAKNDVIDSDEWFTTFTVNLVTAGGITSTLTTTAPSQGGRYFTVSGTVSGLNFDNLSGVFYLAASSSAALFDTDGNGTSDSATAQSSRLSGATVALRSGAVTTSFDAYTVTANSSFSAALRYVATSGGTGLYDGFLVGSVVAKAASAAVVTSLVSTVVESDHSTDSDQSVAVRPNQTYKVRVHASTNSVSLSGVVVSVALSSNATLAADTKTISVNGGAATTSFPTALEITTGADGYASFTIATQGFANSETIVVNAKNGNVSAGALTLTATSPAYTVINDYDNYTTTPGTAVNITYEVEDQWQVLSTRTDQRLKVTRGGTGFAYAETVSTVVVANGKATFAFTPSPATKTGSATVNAVLERFDADLNAWVSGGTAAGAITVNVSSTADAFSVSPALSKSASVSYFPSTVSWVTFTGTVKNAGASVEVSGADNLVFRAASGKATASAKLVVRADASGNFTFDVASLKAKSHTISMKVGTAVTTSQLVVDAPSGDLGKAITFDTTTITPGSTKVITGTLVDANGNAVYTTGSATIEVTYVPTGNAGIPIGSMPTETDSDGKFTFTVLTGANDNGTAKITAVYLKSGASTATADKLTFTQTVSVAAPAPVTPPAADQKLTVGSFKGYVAIYAKGYAGKKLSAKVAGKWISVASLSDFQRVVRNTGAGYTIKVDLYIDGSLVKSETVTTK